MDFGRVITAMITPFTKDNQVDFKKAQELVDYLLANGSDSVVVAGTTGESPTLSKEEKLKLISAVKEVAKGRGGVIAGTSSYDTAASVEMTKKAESAGADGILAVSPYYNKPPQEGLYQHFTAIAGATSLPVIIYNIPGRCGVNILPKTMYRLSKVDNIVADKEAAGSVDQLGEIRALCDDDFLLYSGDDSMTLPFMSLGAVGVISVASHLVGKEIKEMVEAFANGNPALAAEWHYKLLPMFKKLFVVTNPIPVKYCVDRAVMPVGPTRLPMNAPSAEEKAIFDSLLQEYGLI